MATKARFFKAADNARPFKSHRYDVFGLKIDRTLTLFGRAPLNVWIWLEADPSITFYCERPIVLTDSKPRRVVDFWVQCGSREELWILQRPSELTTGGDPRELMPGFCIWADSQRMTVKLINPAEFDGQVMFLDNWGTMIRDLSANKRFLATNFINRVWESAQAPTTMSALGEHFPNEDPVLVRTATFALLHGGKLRCRNIDKTPLGPRSMVEAV